MRYVGNYDTFENPVKSKSLLWLQNHIEKSAGYEGGDTFNEYETARIDGFNFIGRNVVTYYFSMNGNRWNRTDWSIKNYHSWSYAVSPIKEIAQWILDFFGFRAEQEKRIRDFTQKKEIDKLYGR